MKFYIKIRSFYDILIIDVAFWYMEDFMMDNLTFSIFPSANYIDLALYQYGWEHCDPGHSFGPARRNHYLFHYVISGTGILMADDSKGQTQTYRIKSGQGFLIFPHQVTTYFADANYPWEYTWIEFDGLRVKEALSITDLSLDSPLYHASFSSYRDSMSKEMLYIANHSDQSPFHLIGHLYLFFDYLIQSCRKTHPVESSKMSDYYIREAITFIEQNFQNDISIEDIAARVGINRSYFGKIFHKVLGTSPQEFLINYRMTKATELLKLTSLSIAEIGNAVGYPNQLHFSRAFKNVYGISPKNWRDAH